ncbi:2324_t:CDS:2 [Scutellospora calospora]|uniref:2324_t:CDS:1 n=1 Tax=Scutellospora calospora TaxID=85575 RepID=A0ACA9K8V3_9GLOM|nr:2324_t:CDS:2 [Scutellospora calospora]
MSKRKDTLDDSSQDSKKQKTTTPKQAFLTSWIKQPSSASGETVTKVTGKMSEEMKKLLKTELETMDGEWLKALVNEMQKPYFAELKKFLATEKSNNKKIFPPETQIYSWSKFTPPSAVKVVILGQDPYHNDGQAHGLCFSVPPNVQPPPSLINIYKGLQNDIPTFQIPKHGYLVNWAKSGVLLLNTVLTVRAHEALSHNGKGWERFTDAIIQYLNEKKTGLVFMLWGGHAIKKGKVINKTRHLVLEAVHPSPLSVHRGFLDCRHWSKANKYLKEHGKEEIEWNCLVENKDVPTTNNVSIKADVEFKAISVIQQDSTSVVEVCDK